MQAAIVAVLIFAVAVNAGVLLQSPVVFNTAHSTSYKIRAPVAKVVHAPVVHHVSPVVHHVAPVHTYAAHHVPVVHSSPVFLH